MKLNYRFLLLTLFGLYTFYISLPQYPLFAKLAQWLISYEFGFVKRGMVGSIISVIPIQPGYIFLLSCALIVHIVLLFALIAYSARRLSEGSNNSWLLFLLLFMGSSATIQHFTYDMGRFDHFLLLILLASLAILDFKPKLKWLIVPMCLIGMLIHEAFFFLFFPFILAASFYLLQNSPQQKAFLTTLSMTVFIILVFIVVFGSMETIDEAAYLEYLALKTYDFTPTQHSISPLFLSLEKNIFLTLNYLLQAKTLKEHILLLLWQLPVLIVLYYIITSIYNSVKKLNELRYFILLLASAAAPLLMYFLGIDFYRWIAAAMTNMFLLVVLLSSNDVYFYSIKNTVYKHRLLVLTGLVVSLLVGPLGYLHPFPSPMF